MNHLKKLTSLLLAALLLLALAPVQAGASQSALAGQVDQLMTELTQQVKDPWQMAICEAGVQGLEIEGDTVTVFLRSFVPEPNKLPKLAQGLDAWAEALHVQMLENQVKLSLKTKDGQLVAASAGKLKTAVQQAAAKAKAGFGQPGIKNGLLAIFFPKVFADNAASKKYSLSQDFAQWAAFYLIGQAEYKQFAALLYSWTSPQINLSGGPHALVFSAKGALPATLLAAGSKAAYQTLSKQALANIMDQEELKEALDAAMLESAAALRRGAAQKISFTAGVMELAAGSCLPYKDILSQLLNPQTMEELWDQVTSLPDFPAQDYPQNGRISGSSSGTKVVVKAPRDGLARYVQLRRSSDDRLMVDFFIRPGGSATVRTSQGESYLLIAQGSTWYGTKGLFGEEGQLSRTQDFEVPSPDYYYTITLQTSSDGNLSVYGADPDMFGN